MSLSTFKNGEPVYVVIYRDAEARSRLTQWSNSSKSIQCRVEDNRMQIFDHNTLMIFVVTWTHAWDNILIWDTYLKRHISF